MSRRHNRAAKERRRQLHADAGEHRHVTGDEDLSRCNTPGCSRRWVLHIERTDGWSTFQCQEHGMPVAEELADAGQLASVTGSYFDPDLIGAAWDAGIRQQKDGAEPGESLPRNS